MRSFLRVHVEHAAACAAITTTSADALIIDLTRKNKAPSAYGNARAAIDAARAGVRIFAQVNAAASGFLDDDLAAIMPSRPEGIVFPAGAGNVDIEQLSTKLRVFEANLGIPDAQTRIILLIDSPSALLAMNNLRAHSRIAAIGWMPFHPNPSFSASDILDERGNYLDLPRYARMMTLLAAGHLGVSSIDAPYPTDKPDMLHRDVLQSRRDGFAAKMALSEEHVQIIKSAFM